MRLLLALAPLLAACAPALLNAVAPVRGVEVARLTYGPDPRQVADLYDPGRPGAPLLVFVHGGAWTAGSPDLYPFLGHAFADEGFAVAIPGYRLHPQVTFPAFVEDAAAAVAALRARFPDRPLVLAGHSAGAQIAALVALDPRYLAAHGLVPCRDLAGFVGISGPYDFLPLKEDIYKAVFPEPVRAESQPVAFAAGRHPPALLLHGAADDTVEPADATILAEALLRAGNTAEARLYQGVGHLDILGAVSPLLGRLAPTRADVAAFVRQVAAAPQPAC